MAAAIAHIGHTQASPRFDAEDEIKLEQLGYKQELRRGMGLIGSIGVATGIIQPLLNGGLFLTSFVQGGPVATIWGFIIFFFCSVGLMLSMAEISSRYIIAGGPYTWAALGGTDKWWKKFFPFVNAWLVMLSFFGSMASVNSAAAQALYSMDIMRTFGAKPNDAFVERELDLWDPVTAFSHQGEYGTWKNMFGITVAITVSQFALNLLPLKWMNKASWASFFVMVFGSLILIIGLPAIAPTHQTWKWVWTKWYSQEENPVGSLAHTGLPSNGWMFCAGMLMSQFLVNCYDIPAHMAEETHNASWTVPRSIVGSFVCAGLLNLCLLLSYLFSVQHLGNLGWGVTQGLYPIGNLFWDIFAARWPDTAIASGATGGPGSGPYQMSSTSSDGDCLLKSGAACVNVMTGLPNPTVTARNGSIFFTFIIFCGAYICGLMNCCAGSRFLYALARDGGLPFSGFLRKVADFNGVPVRTLLLFVTISICFLTCNLSTNPLEGYLSVSGISSNGYLMAYGVPCLLRLTIARKTFKATPDFDLGFMSKPLAALGVAVSAFSVATIALPAYLPANKDNLNFSGVALGAVLVLACLTFPFALKFWGYTAPQTGVDLKAEYEESLKSGKAGLEAPAEEAPVAAMA